MKKSYFMIGTLVCFTMILSLTSCAKSNKTIIRMQHLEEGVGSPTSIEELKDAIKKYQDRVADIQLSQTQIGIWYKILATRYLDAKMYGEALKTFQKALEFYPDNQNLYYYVGLCAGYMSHASMDFDATGTTDKRANYLKLSEDAYKRAIRIKARYFRYLSGLSVLYVYELGRESDAIPLLEKLLSIDTKHLDAMFILARAYYMSYDFDKAVSMYDKIISITKSEDRKKEAEANKQTVLNAAYSE